MTIWRYLPKATAYIVIIPLVVAMGVKSESLLAGGVTQLRVHKQMDLPTATTGVAWSKSGTAIAVYSEAGKNISIWNLDGKRLSEMNRTVNGPWYESSIAFLDGDKSVLTPPALEHVPQYALSVWNVESGSVVRNIEGAGWAYAFVVSADQSTVAISTDGGRTIAVYSAGTWIEFPRPSSASFGHALAIALSPNGSMLALGTTRGQVVIFKTETGALLRVIDAYDKYLGMGVAALAFSPDGARIATGAAGSINRSQDDRPVRVWSIQGEAMDSPVFSMTLQPVRAITWRVQGDRIAFVVNNEIRVWGLADGTVTVRSLQPDVMDAAFSPSGNHLAVCDGDHVTIFDVGESN